MTPALDMQRLCVQLSGKPVLHDVSLNAGSGDFIGLIGPNGAGKSTLLRTAAGLTGIESGVRTLDGADIETLSPIARARRLAFLPQARPVYWSMTARAIVTLGRFAYGGATRDHAQDTKAVDAALQEAGAAHLGDRPASDLSGGERARIHLARTLAGQTSVILADEPITALDPAHQLSVMSLLRAKAEAGGTVIAALHDLTLAARYCTRLITLHHGRVIADGAPRNILTADLLRDIFGVSARIAEFDDGIELRLTPL